jgi:hypothetical protein
MLGRLGFDMARSPPPASACSRVAVALGAPLRGGPLAVLAIAVLLAGWTHG